MHATLAIYLALARSHLALATGYRGTHMHTYHLASARYWLAQYWAARPC